DCRSKIFSIPWNLCGVENAGRSITITMTDNNKKLHEMVSEAKMGGGSKRIAKQHEKKKLTARERVEYLLDEGSFEEMGILVTHRTTDFNMQEEVYYGDGVVTGYGTVNDRLVYVFAQDFTVFGGALS